MERPKWQDIVPSLVPSWGTTNALSLYDMSPTLFDVSGRPLSEKLLPNPAGVPFDVSPSPFLDARHGKPTNVSAFEALAPHFNDILQLISYLRSVIRPYSKKPTHDSISETLYTGMILPIWLVLKADNPLKNGDIPLVVAGVHKVARGAASPFAMTRIEKIVNDGERHEFSAATPSEYMKFVDEHKILVDQTACPAPRRMIVRLVEVLLQDPAEGAEDIGKKLGLSPDDVMRAKKLSLAYETAVTEKVAFDRIAYPDSAARRRLVQKWNNAQRWASEALGRIPPSKVTDSDIEGMIIFR